VIADIVVDLQYGDCGKGKVTHHLLKNNNYTHCIRYNGGCNAGHTIFHEGKRYITHHIPAGVFFGVKSIIGSGCVLNPEQFFDEIKELQSSGIDCEELVKVANNAHIITDAHLIEDGKDDWLGTTRRGNGPAYRDKYSRTGYRAESTRILDSYLVDLYEELYENDKEEPVVLLEGAQGFGLDIDWGDFPYVTSSHCTTAGALLNAISHRAIRRVWGVAKCYETYVGSKRFQPKDQDIFNMIREVGKEFGATTGRPRQCNWMNINLLKKAITINDVTDLVINKMDVLRQVGVWKIRHDDDNSIVTKLQNEAELKKYLTKVFPDIRIHFSDNPERI
jgi:adenylosuccinate synthase